MGMDESLSSKHDGHQPCIPHPTERVRDGDVDRCPDRTGLE